MTKNNRKICAEAFAHAISIDEPVLVARHNDGCLVFSRVLQWFNISDHVYYTAVMLIFPSGSIHFYDTKFKPKKRKVFHGN